MRTQAILADARLPLPQAHAARVHRRGDHQALQRRACWISWSATAWPGTTPPTWRCAERVMGSTKEASRDAYDAIVVGSGLGGLTTAALLARAGRRVWSWNDTIGPAAMPTRSAAGAISSTRRCISWRVASRRPGPRGGVLHRLLAGLGVRQSLRVRPRGSLLPRRMARLRARRPDRARAIRRGAQRTFPARGEGDSRLLPRIASRSATRSVGQATTWEQRRATRRSPEHFPLLLRYRRATLARVLDAPCATIRLRAPRWLRSGHTSDCLRHASRSSISPRC